jgi:hypothetical protein
MRSATILLFLAWAGSAAAGEQREAVLDLLNAYEATATADDLKRLGDGVELELISIADDQSVPTTRRGRAIVALGHFPTVPVRAWLEIQLHDRAKESIFRRKAAWALAVGFGDQVVETHLKSAIADDDVQLRIAVANALGQLRTSAALGVLEARLEQESDEAVRLAIKKFVEEK